MYENSLGDSCSVVDHPEEKIDELTMELNLMRQETTQAATFRDEASRRVAEAMKRPRQIQRPHLMSSNSEEVQAISQSLQALKHHNHDHSSLAKTQFTDLSQLNEEDPNTSSRARRLLDMSAKLRRIGELVLEKEKEMERSAREQKMRGDWKNTEFECDDGPDPPCHPCYDPPGYEPIMLASFVDSVEEEKSFDDFEVSLATLINQSSGPFASLFRTIAEMQIPPPNVTNDPPGKEPCAEASIMHYVGDGGIFFSNHSIGGVEDDNYLGTVPFERHYHEEEIEFPNEEIPNTPVYFSIHTSDCEASVEVVLAESFDDESFNFDRDCGIAVFHQSGIGAVSDVRGRYYDVANIFPSEELANPAADESHTSTTALSSIESDRGYQEGVYHRCDSPTFERRKRRLERDNVGPIPNSETTDTIKKSAYERLLLRNRSLHSRGLRPPPQEVFTGSGMAETSVPPFCPTTQGTLSVDLRKRQLDKALAKRVGASPLRKEERIPNDRLGQHSRESPRSKRVVSPRRHAPKGKPVEQSVEGIVRSKQREPTHHPALPKKSSSPSEKRTKHRGRERDTNRSRVQGGGGGQGGTMCSGGVPVVPEAQQRRRRTNPTKSDPGPVPRERRVCEGGVVQTPRKGRPTTVDSPPTPRHSDVPRTGRGC